MARCSVEDAYAHALRRETFGKKLIENQVILTKFAEMARQIEPIQTYMEALVYILEHERLNPQAMQADALNMGGMTATLKTGAARALERVNREAQQILGGAGYSRTGKGARIEQISRDIRVMVVGGGSEEILDELAVKQEMRELPRIQQRLSKM